MSEVKIRGSGLNENILCHKAMLAQVKHRENNRSISRINCKGGEYLVPNTESNNE
jgi:hypothetical protein